MKTLVLTLLVSMTISFPCLAQSMEEVPAWVNMPEAEMQLLKEVGIDGKIDLKIGLPKDSKIMFFAIVRVVKTEEGYHDELVGDFLPANKVTSVRLNLTNLPKGIYRIIGLKKLPTDWNIKKPKGIYM